VFESLLDVKNSSRHLCETVRASHRASQRARVVDVHAAMLPFVARKKMMAQASRADCACGSGTRENRMPLYQFAGTSDHAL
jgi:hypothetical protein